ncbi:YaaR family protein [Ectobacillus polymachus]|uniref:YaaR family protein n=1 Tax=Ectobacillus polymachus TaxID=1508806 RepID=UPI003A839A54
MKIEQGFPISSERFLPIREKTNQSTSFGKIMEEKQSVLTNERLHTLMSEIEKQGDRLQDSQTLQDLISYKKSIHSFLQEVIQNGLSLEEKRGQLPNGREKKLKLIKQVDQKLLELSQQVLDQSLPSVSMLAKMGEIKGLLVNLYL